MLPSPSPQTFTTFNTFTTFAKFAKFAKFANINSALEHPSLIHCHAPRLGSISEHAISTPHPPLLSPTGRVPEKRVAG
jgi:hypothetical protein